MSVFGGVGANKHAHRPPRGERTHQLRALEQPHRGQPRAARGLSCVGGPAEKDDRALRCKRDNGCFAQHARQGL